MAAETRKTRTVTSTTVALICDRCHRRVPMDGPSLEVYEFVRVRHEGGHASVWGDGVIVDVDLCQQCFHALTCNFARVTLAPWRALLSRKQQASIPAVHGGKVGQGPSAGVLKHVKADARFSDAESRDSAIEERNLRITALKGHIPAGKKPVKVSDMSPASPKKARKGLGVPIAILAATPDVGRDEDFTRHPAKPKQSKVRFGVLKGKVRVAADFDAPAADPLSQLATEARKSTRRATAAIDKALKKTAASMNRIETMERKARTAKTPRKGPKP